MAEFLHYNKDRGTWYEADFHEDGSFTFTTKQDIEPVIDYATKIRNSGANDKKLGDWYLQRYAIIPAHVEVELRAKGINIYNPSQTKELLREINTNYPYLKTSNRKHQ